MAGDAHHVAAPTEDGDGPRRAMRAALGALFGGVELLCAESIGRDEHIHNLENERQRERERQREIRK